MAGGWIKAHRSMMRHPALQNDATFRVWMLFLLMATHKPRKMDWRGQTIGLHAGQLAISVRHFSEKYGFSYKAVRHAMDRLIRDECIEVMQIKGTVLGAGRGAGRGALGSVVTICNWAKYQGEDDDWGAEEAHLGAQQGRNRGALNKNDKKEEERIYTPPNGDGYAFEGKLIRLNQRDYDGWRKRYSAIPDFDAELGKLDDFYDEELVGRERAKWFVRCSAALDKKHQEHTPSRSQPQRKQAQFL